MSQFVHLHVHTDYSMLDGACRVESLAKLAASLQMPAVACTDHGNMSGAIDFYKTMRANGVKPILGCEFYVAPGSCTEKDNRDGHAQGFHLVLLAEDLDGYRNLCRLNEQAWLHGFYYKPRVDKALLRRYKDGLIALSACVGGEIPARIIEHDERRAVLALEEYLDIYGRDHFFIELQDHGMDEEKRSNPRLVELAREYGIPLVATNDSHYLNQSHALAQEVMLCIGTQSTMADPARFRFPNHEFYFKSAEEMSRLFSDYPQALENTLAIAERCNVNLRLGEGNHYPVFKVPGTQTREAYLRNLCVEALKERYALDVAAGGLTDDQSNIVARMDYELGIIAQAGFTSYFLVVWDFLHFAREQKVPVGPGRGSGAGSIVAYLLHITDIEPLRYGLLFERFLNPDRVSPPDFDIDLCERRRVEVIDYVRNKYGQDCVAQIGTFGTLKAKAVIKDVARALGQPFDKVNTLTKLIPGDPGMTLEKAIKDNRELRELRENEEWVSEIFKFSEVLEGMNRNMSIHAAGVIIGDQPLSNVVPLARGAGNEVITQYPAGPCEELGLLKMDFLGLRTLTIIQDALELVEQSRGIKLAASDIPMDDAKTFELLNKGNTIAIFQLESGGMRDLCRRFGVDRIEDIIALIALYRPGPMQFLDDFISRKTGETQIEYDVPSMRPILEETYGIMLYQEQVMQVVQRVAGFSLGQADILRRAMGKKKEKDMEKQREKFFAGCGQNGIIEGKANEIWEKIKKFAGYGFNKSHSAAYAFLSYRTAYLKANFPVEFMAAVLSSELGSSEKIAFLLKECKEMGIEIKPPDVNTSGLRFSVDRDSIRFGLGAIKGVGSSAADAIIDTRRDKGNFQRLNDFCERVGGRVNKRVMECLCRCGAFDSFKLTRSQVFAILDDVIAQAQQTISDRAKGQGLLFDFGGNNGILAPEPPDLPEWPDHQMLADEKELLGFYVTGHPLAEYADIIESFQIDAIERLAELSENIGTRIGGLISQVDIKHSKKDQRQWAILTIEGLESSLECMVFADVYEEYGSLIQPESVVFVEGTVSRRNGDAPSLVVRRLTAVNEAVEKLTSEIHIHIHEASTSSADLERLRLLCRQYAGDTPVVFCIVCASGEIAFVQSDSAKVRNAYEFRAAVKDLFGEECLRQKAKRERPESDRRNRGTWSDRQPEARVQ